LRLRQQRLAKGHVHADIVLNLLDFPTDEQPHPREVRVQPDPLDAEPLGIQSYTVVNTPIRQQRDEPSGRLLHAERKSGHKVEISRGTGIRSEPESHQHSAPEDEVLGIWQPRKAQQNTLKEPVTDR